MKNVDDKPQSPEQAPFTVSSFRPENAEGIVLASDSAKHLLEFIREDWRQTVS